MDTEGKDSIELQIGRRIRELRTRRNVTLGQLAEEVKLTKGQLSKIENGHVSSPISTLVRIASALGSGVDALLYTGTSSIRAVLVKKSQRKPIVGRGSKIGHSYESLAFGLPFGKDFECYLMTIEETRIRPAQNIFKHPGHEFLFMVEGVMTYRHGERTFEMEPGDSLFFDATIEHGPVSVASTPAKFLSIISNTER